MPFEINAYLLGHSKIFNIVFIVLCYFCCYVKTYKVVSGCLGVHIGNVVFLLFSCSKSWKTLLERGEKIQLLPLSVTKNKMKKASKTFKEQNLSVGIGPKDKNP